MEVIPLELDLLTVEVEMSTAEMEMLTVKVELSTAEDVRFLKCATAKYLWLGLAARVLQMSPHFSRSHRKLATVCKMKNIIIWVTFLALRYKKV